MLLSENLRSLHENEAIVDSPQDASLLEGTSWPAADGPAQLSHPGVGLLCHRALVLVLSKIKKTVVSKSDSKSLLPSTLSSDGHCNTSNTLRLPDFRTSPDLHRKSYLGTKPLGTVSVLGFLIRAKCPSGVARPEHDFLPDVLVATMSLRVPGVGRGGRRAQGHLGPFLGPTCRGICHHSRTFRTASPGSLALNQKWF